MKFLERFSLAVPPDAEPNSISGSFGIAAGMYAHGLISILDKNLSISALSDWSQILGVSTVALASTAFGDVFFWSENDLAIYYLEVQQGEAIRVGNNIAMFFEEFLTAENIINQVLRSDDFEKIRSKGEGLKYGECYIARPWQMLGGDGDLESYQRGDLDVYLSLTGKTICAQLG
ncbi:T6SS immunity protein Tdi1 domain-containing protein [Cupriavidus plantarum]|uniref:T6SS immunity protein Tdi1 domain-containing protein n=1 Tax=Cupriavidus plantarum TaxID=942865 RepID=UPI00339D4945